MKIVLHTNGLTERGTTTAILDYADYLSCNGVTPIIAWDHLDSGNSEKMIAKVKVAYETYPYRLWSSFSKDVSRQVDGIYLIKDGRNDGKIVPNIKNYVHSVFQYYEPHGTKYAYVSEWLAKRMRLRNLRNVDSRVFDSLSKKNFIFVPHIVNLPSPKFSLRRQLKIPKEALVGGRHGGKDSFDVSFVREFVKNFVNESEKNYFIFINTNMFYEHSRIKYVSETVDRQDVSNFLNSIDFFLHGRRRGESFGLALLEAMLARVPVFSYKNGVDGNHRFVLRESKMSLFSNSTELEQRIARIADYSDLQSNFSEAVKFNSAIVGKKFMKVFEID